MQTCASILRSVKWNIGRMSSVPFEMRKALHHPESAVLPSFENPGSRSTSVWAVSNYSVVTS